MKSETGKGFLFGSVSVWAQNESRIIEVNSALWSEQISPCTRGFKCVLMMLLFAEIFTGGAGDGGGV